MKLPRVAKEPSHRPNPFRQPIADPWETEFRHIQWQPIRDRVRSAMVSAGTGPRAVERFDNCGAECLIEYSKELDRYRLRASYCRCRHCRPCMRAKGSLIAANIKEKIAPAGKLKGRTFRFITLTLRHSRRCLLDQIKDLYRHWRILRKSPMWKKTQLGGCVQLEVGLNVAGEWHPHLHIISEGSYIRQEELANEWMRITAGSFMVDVRAIDSGKDAAAYVAKYICKGTSDAVWADHKKAIEWIVATRSLHICSTWGTWRGFKLLSPDPCTTTKDWKPIALLTRVIENVSLGSLADSYLLEHLINALQYDPSRGWQKQQKPAG